MQLVATTDRAAVGALLKLKEYVDVLVPRGGKSLIERVSAESTIPVIKHLDGICHVYIDDGADPDMAVAIAFNSKTEKYAVCNAMETLLVAQSIAPRVLPSLRHQFERAGVELRGCAKTRVLLPGIGARDGSGLADGVSRADSVDSDRRAGSTKRSITSPRMVRSIPTQSSPTTTQGRDGF